MGKLTDRAVKTLGSGKHGDGDGLTLVVAETGARRWFLRYQLAGKRRDMGLGSFPEIGLSAARAAAAAARALAAQGIDPLTAREARRKAERPVPTFSEIAKDVIAEAQARTTNSKVAYQWARHLGPAYCGPLLNRSVSEITTTDVVAVLRPVWRAKPEVARKLYPAIRRVFDAARIRLRDEHGIKFDNPARWDDLKAMGFEAPQQLTRGRQPSLPYQEMPEFMAAVRERDAIAARLMEFVILTNIRSGAARAAEWKQFDLDAGVWLVPVANLKDKRHRTEAFRVPLSPRAIEILSEMEGVRVNELVFPSPRSKMFSDMAMLVLLKRMSSGDRKWVEPSTGKPIVPHGFRSSFRTWAEECAAFPHAIIEEAMGHVVGTAVERAYRRTDVLEQRRALMTAWQNYCEPKAGANVLAFTKSGGKTA